MKREKRSDKRGKARSLFLIVNLVLSTIAFSFIIGLSSEVVSGTQPAIISNPTSPNILTPETISALQQSSTSLSQEINNLIQQQAAATDAKTIANLNKLISEKRATLGSVNSQLSAYNEQLFKGATESGKVITGEYLGKTAGKLGNDWYVQDNSGNLIKINNNLLGTSAGKLTSDFNGVKAETEVFQANGKYYSPDGKEIAGLKADQLIPKEVSEAPIFGGYAGASYIFGNLFQGIMWAGTVAGAIQLLGGLFGLDPGIKNALTYGAISGIVGAKLAWGIAQAVDKTVTFKGDFFLGMSKTGTWTVVGGIALAAIVFIMTYSETEEKLVTFECQTWEAPSGGNDCEKCNSDLYPCTEYRCKSLGQACQLLNAGTGQEKCAWVNPKDVNSPIIQTDDKVLTADHKYNPNTAIRPPDRGVKIQYSKASDGCVKAFTPLTFGIILNEPAQCKIDYNRTGKYDDMAYYFGGSNIYKYNHTQTLALPSPDAINAEAPELKVDGNYNLYVRCKDANGNVNDDLFVFSFCVEKGPDVTPPVIESTSIANNMPFQYGLTETPIEVYVNEPADCKWSKLNMDYKDMENTMTCNQHVYEMNNQMLYKCTTTLTGLLDRQDNVFYFRCKDQPVLKGTDKESDRNVNMESYKFTLKGSQPLTITDVKPNETIKGAGTLATLYLEITTDNGYNEGDSWCSYSTTTNEKDYIQMFETGTNKHKQRLDLPSGTYTYYFQCVDLGGNSVWTNTTFNVQIDNQAPTVVRAYKSGTNLKIFTDEKSTCSYSNSEDRKCNFQISEGTNMPYVNSTEHSASWVTKNYYIKCQDLGGRQPNPDECSIVVKPES